MKKSKKKDLIGYKEFNRFSKKKKKRHVSANGQLPKDDENTNQLEETLIGMEYDLDPDEEDEIENEEYNEQYDEEYPETEERI